MARKPRSRAHKAPQPTTPQRPAKAPEAEEVNEAPAEQAPKPVAAPAEQEAPPAPTVEVLPSEEFPDGVELPDFGDFGPFEEDADEPDAADEEEAPAPAPRKAPAALPLVLYHAAEPARTVRNAHELARAEAAGYKPLLEFEMPKRKDIHRRAQGG